MGLYYELYEDNMVAFYDLYITYKFIQHLAHKFI
jgi:hypothetical protein